MRREPRPEQFDRVDVKQEFLTNTPSRGERPPDLEWSYFLFCEGFRKNKKGEFKKYGRKFVHELTAATDEEVLTMLEEFVQQPNVVLQEA
jgi:hypothetical protein